MHRLLVLARAAARRRTVASALLLGLTTTLAPALAATDLLTVLAAAEQSDPTYHEAQASAMAVAEGVPQARADLFLPNLAFRAGTGRVRQDIELANAFGADGLVYFNQHSYGVSLQQPVYFHDRLIALRQADKRVQQAQLEVVVAHQDLMLRVAERYFEVLAARDSLQFAQAAKESLERQLEQARQRFEVGLIAITDVQEAQAGYDRALADEISAQNAIENAIEALREVTASYHDDLLELGDTLPLGSPEPANIDAWTRTAIDNNLEIAAALAATDIAREEISRQTAQHYPTLAIVGGHNFNRAGGRFGSAKVHQSDINLELNLPLYNGGRVLSQTRQAEHEHRATLDRLEQARRGVQRDTRQAYLGVSARISSVKALEQAVLSSSTALESTRAGFEVGTRTAVDVVAAERVLSEARRDLARARYDYILETLRLKQAAGSLSPDDLAVVNAWLVAPDVDAGMAHTTH
ncbi:MAG: TolC family outer membrane protein [Gammaproteobacteria bacterium]